MYELTSRLPLGSVINGPAFATFVNITDGVAVTTPFLMLS